MKTVLCYGDSNTYGYNPSDGFRYPESVRWTCRLQKLLGDDYRIIEEGCNGRTTVLDDPIEGWKNGRDYLEPCLNSHKPIDIVILMLGSNDLKETFHASAEQIAEGAGELVDIIQSFTLEKQGYVPEIILVSPTTIGEGIKESPFYGAFYENAIERSREFPNHYRKVAEEKGCVFFNAADHVSTSTIDSLHFSPEGHRALAEGIFQAVKNLESTIIPR